MKRSVLYLGDTSLTEAASYLAGVMKSSGIEYEYLASDEAFDEALLDREPALVVISDYPSSNFSLSDLEKLTARVSDGLGLVMLGGWESFTGLGGDYHTSALAELLPVEMQGKDDRVNCAQPCLVEKVSAHPIVDSLPFDEEPPTIGGFNLLKAKPDARTVLNARRYRVERRGNQFEFGFRDAFPLLVTGSAGQGRTVAFATDVAPHWVGGLVDWGDERVTAQGPGAAPIEVGNWYAGFFRSILQWAGGQLHQG